MTDACIICSGVPGPVVAERHAAPYGTTAGDGVREESVLAVLPCGHGLCEGCQVGITEAFLDQGSTHKVLSPPAIRTAEVASESAVSEKGLDLTNNRFKTAKEDVLDSYDKWADAYEKDSMEKLGFTSPKVCVDTLLRFCPPDGKDILDIGAGTGLLAQMICSQGHKAKSFDAMDLSPKMLEHLVTKGIYSKAEAWNMMEYPWPFPSNHYDGSMCNGVLIYVDDPECLEEFVRVTKPGGICVVMFRHDGYPLYEKKDAELRARGAWELVHKTTDKRNFQSIDFGENPEDDVIFNQWVFRVLETSEEKAVVCDAVIGLCDTEPITASDSVTSMTASDSVTSMT